MYRLSETPARTEICRAVHIPQRLLSALEPAAKRDNVTAEVLVYLLIEEVIERRLVDSILRGHEQDDDCERLPLKDIAMEIAEETGISLELMRSLRRNPQTIAARKEYYRRARIKRPDLSSTQVANFIRKEGSTVRHFWRQMECQI